MIAQQEGEERNAERDLPDHRPADDRHQRREEAQQVVDNYARAYQQAAEKVEALKQQAEQQAREAADVAAKNLSKAAWGTLITLLISGALSFAIGRFALTSRNRQIATLR